MKAALLLSLLLVTGCGTTRALLDSLTPEQRTQVATEQMKHKEQISAFRPFYYLGAACVVTGIGILAVSRTSNRAAFICMGGGAGMASLAYLIPTIAGYIKWLLLLLILGSVGYWIYCYLPIKKKSI